MKNYFKYSVLGVSCLTALAFFAQEFFPAQTAGAVIYGYALSAGLTAKQMETPLGTIHYLEGGSGETVVFVHGIFARKEHWIDMSRRISDGYHVVLLDLPGFGDNPALPEGGYNLSLQADNLVSILDALQIKRFHIAANSMGGQLAGMVATRLKDRVISAAFIGSPVGITAQEKSDLEGAAALGKTPLVVTTLQDYQDRMNWLFPHKPFVPAPIEKLWSQQEVAQATTNQRIWREVMQSRATPLQQLAPDIKQLTLIVWCKQDRIFHPSGANVLDAALPNGRIVWLDDCGHVPMLDQPKASGDAYRSFLDEQK